MGSGRSEPIRWLVSPAGESEGAAGRVAAGSRALAERRRRARARAAWLAVMATLLPFLVTLSPEPMPGGGEGGPAQVVSLRLRMGLPTARALFVGGAWDRFRRAVRRGWENVDDATRRAWRHVKDQARRAIDGVRNMTHDLVGRAQRLAQDAADQAARLAEEARSRAAAAASRVGDAVRAAADRARDIANRARDAVNTAVEAARKAAEAAAAAAKAALGAIGGVLSGGEVDVPVWRNPDLSCKIRVRDPAGSVKSCVTTVAGKVLAALPWLKEPLALVGQIKDKAQAFAAPLFSCIKNTVQGGVREAGRLVSGLVRDPLGTVKGVFTGTLDLLSREAGPLLQMLDPRRLLGEVMGLLPKQKETPKKKGPDGEEETDLQAESAQRPSPVTLLGSIAGPLTDKVLRFVDTMPDQVWATIDRWKAGLARKGIKAPFACLPLVKKAFNQFKTPIMTVVKAVVAKTKDVMAVISPVLDKIVNQVLEIAVGILSGTSLFKKVKDAVTVAFVDSTAALNSKITRVREILSGAAADPEAEIKKIAKDVIGSIPFLKLTFWVQAIKEPVKDKITEKAIELGNEAVDWVMSTIRAELMNLLNRLIDWASETIPYASYVLADLGPVIMWIVRIAWDKVIDPIVRALAREVISLTVTYSVDFAVELVAAALREGTTRLDALIQNGIGTAIDKIPVPAALKGIMMVVLKIYKQYVEPQVNTMQGHLTALNSFLKLLVGYADTGEEEGGDAGGGESGAGEGGAESGAGAKAVGGKLVGGKLLGAKVVGAAGGAGAMVGPSAAAVAPGAPAAVSAQLRGSVAPPGAAVTPARVAGAFHAASAALARDRVAGLMSLRTVTAQAMRLSGQSRQRAYQAVAALRNAVSQAFRLVYAAQAAIRRTLQKPPPSAGAALGVLAGAAALPPAPGGIAAAVAPVYQRFAAAARRYLQAAAAIEPSVAAFQGGLTQALGAGDAALSTLATVGGGR